MRHKEIAATTVAALERGSYTTEDGKEISIASQLQACVEGTVFYLPEVLNRLRDEVLAKAPRYKQTTFEARNETTLQGAERLVRSGQYGRVAALNFASAKNPGGGFLGGAKAQEESLARSSGLYHSLLKAPAYYSFHRAQATCLYSDRMIYSPTCPVMRNDDGDWLAEPYTVDFITSPAPNAGAIAKNEPENVPQIVPVLRERASKVLALAASNQSDALILGAWGCGVFRNDPAQVAGIFADLLGPAGPYWGRFRFVLFSVLDSRPGLRMVGPFVEAFGTLSEAG